MSDLEMSPPLPEGLSPKTLALARAICGEIGDWYSRAKAWLAIATLTKDPKDFGKAWDATNHLAKHHWLEKVKILTRLFQLNADSDYLKEARASAKKIKKIADAAYAWALIATVSTRPEDLDQARASAQEEKDWYFRTRAWLYIYRASKDRIDLGRAEEDMMKIKNFQLKSRAAYLAVRILTQVK